jgi:hypothetical protein
MFGRVVVLTKVTQWLNRHVGSRSHSNPYQLLLLNLSDIKDDEKIIRHEDVCIYGVLAVTGSS